MTNPDPLFSRLAQLDRDEMEEGADPTTAALHRPLDEAEREAIIGAVERRLEAEQRPAPTSIDEARARRRVPRWSHVSAGVLAVAAMAAAFALLTTPPAPIASYEFKPDLVSEVRGGESAPVRDNPLRLARDRRVRIWLRPESVNEPPIEARAFLETDGGIHLLPARTLHREGDAGVFLFELVLDDLPPDAGTSARLILVVGRPRVLPGDSGALRALVEKPASAQSAPLDWKRFDLRIDR